MSIEISDATELRALYGEPIERSAAKTLAKLDKHCLAFIGLSPFCVLGTAAADGPADCSPRGDAPGFVQVIENDAGVELRVAGDWVAPWEVSAE